MLAPLAHRQAQALGRPAPAAHRGGLRSRGRPCRPQAAKDAAQDAPAAPTSSSPSQPSSSSNGSAPRTTTSSSASAAAARVNDPKLPARGYFAIADPNAEVYSKAGEKFDPTKKPGRYKSSFIWNTNWQEMLEREEQLARKVGGAGVGGRQGGKGWHCRCLIDWRHWHPPGRPGVGAGVVGGWVRVGDQVAGRVEAVGPWGEQWGGDRSGKWGRPRQVV